VAIAFTDTVPPEHKNPATLTDGYWAEELSGVLDWALDGLERFLSNRGQCTRSAACEAVKCEYRQDSNPARRFLLENYEVTHREYDRVPVAQLFDECKGWATADGFKNPLTGPRSAKEVDAAFPGIEKAKTCRVEKGSVQCRAGLKKRSVV
jgi:putative DNA primase/helicase